MSIRKLACSLSDIIFAVVLWDKCYLHFSDKESEVQRVTSLSVTSGSGPGTQNSLSLEPVDFSVTQGIRLRNTGKSETLNRNLFNRAEGIGRRVILSESTLNSLCIYLGKWSCFGSQTLFQFNLRKQVKLP